MGRPRNKAKWEVFTSKIVNIQPHSPIVCDKKNSNKCTNDLNPLNPIVHFWLHHTVHCAEKIVSVRLRAGSASAERVGGVTGRVLCTWWLLGLALNRCCAHGGC